MRKIIAATFVTLDGVMQAPGTPDEDRTGHFEFGGWSANYWDAQMGNAMAETMGRPFDLLLGRKTYEIFAAHWPYITNDPIAEKFNSTRKYVVTNKNVALSWNNSTQVSGDTVGELIRLKAGNGDDLLVQGSGRLMQTLLAGNLIDTLHVWTFPVTIGKGKRLFEEGTRPASLKVVASAISTTGVVMTSYAPAGGLVTGSFAPPHPSEAELERRRRWADER